MRGIGGSSGIGNRIAHEFAQRGGKVFVTAARKAAQDFEGAAAA